MKIYWKILTATMVASYLSGALAFAQVNEEQANQAAIQYLNGLDFWHAPGVVTPARRIEGDFERSLKAAPVRIDKKSYNYDLKPIFGFGPTKWAYFVSAHKSLADGFGCWGYVWISAEDGSVLPQVKYREVYWDGSFSHELRDSRSVARWSCETHEEDGIPFP